MRPGVRGDSEGGGRGGGGGTHLNFGGDARHEGKIGPKNKNKF